MTLGLMQATAVKAVEMYALSWRGTLYYTNAAGNVVAKSYTDRDVVKTIADHLGVSPSQVVLVYRPTYLDTAVVVKSTGAWADYLQMPDQGNPNHTDIKNLSGTQTIRQAFLFDESHGSAIGSIFGLERQRWSTDGSTLLSESFHGTFQFANSDPNDPILPVGVFSGSFSTGRKVPDMSQ